jgi:hypothetical protein
VGTQGEPSISVLTESEAGRPPGIYVQRPNDGRGKSGHTDQLWQAQGEPLIPLEALTYWAPRPAEVVDLRAELAAAWAPGGSLAKLSSFLEEVSAGASGPARWEQAMLAQAALWYVGADMAELLVGAAPGLPPVELTTETPPDPVGLVVFERPITGIDSDGSGTRVTVAAMLWGPAWWQRPGHGFQMGAVDETPCLGITCYRPIDVTPGLVPVGSLVWPLGEPTDCALSGEEAKDASMAEDRRRLAALWLLSSQPGLTTNVDAPLPRHVVRRATRTGGPPPRVRVVHLRQAPSRAHDGPGDGQGRTYRHRWAVAGHWRHQACGPRHSEHRPVYINPYLKGPEGAPLVGRPKVKAWTR